MTRPIRPGDFVLISTEGYAEYFKITSVTGTEIRISPPNEPDKISMLVPSPTGEWKVYGTDITFELEFMTQDTFNEREHQKNYLLFLPAEILVNITLDMKIEDVISLCKTHPKLNAALCANQTFWKSRYHRVFGSTNEKPINWKSFYIDKRKSSKGPVISFGNNTHGQLGLNIKDVRISQPMLIPTFESKFVACGSHHTVFIDIDNDIWTVGLNDRGQLGHGDYNRRNHPEKIDNIKAKFAACGSRYTILIDMDDNVIVFGGNGSNQLGFDPFPMFLNKNVLYPYKLVDFKAKFIACGDKHTIFIDLSNDAWAAGDNGESQFPDLNFGEENHKLKRLGLKAQSASCGKENTILIDMNNHLIGYGKINEFDKIYPPAPLFPRWDVVKKRDISDYTQQLNQKDIKIRHVSTGSDHVIVISTDNHVYGFGNNFNGQLGSKSETKELKLHFIPIRSKMAACGLDHTILIDERDKVARFGYNRRGQLGLGHYNNQFSPAWIENIDAISVACGDNYTTVIKKVNED